MTYAEVQKAIESELAKRSKKVRNQNAFGALLGALGAVGGDPASALVGVGALAKLFLGRGEALDAEKNKITVEVILEMLCKIDESISTARESATQGGISLGGFIEASGGTGNVVGVDITQGERVVFQPGTHVRAEGEGNVIGVRIGR